jgi:AhpD family alkylhydroperoxidase
MGTQLELNKKRKQDVEKWKQLLPQSYKGLKEMAQPAYTDGVLSAKVKRLMCLALALGASCTNCVLAQFHGALDAGATKEEFLETLAVAAAMRGNTGVAESQRVIELMDELGML